jgi:hypothetical protein
MTLKGVDLVGTLLQRPSCMKLAFLVFSVALVVLLVPGLAAGADAQANGVYDVQVLSGGTWQTVAAPDFGLAYRTRTVSLDGDVVQVRLVQRGGTAAQIDSVLLDGVSPAAVSGSSDALALWKLRAKDDDVTNIFGDAVVLTFPSGGSLLEIDARVQGDISGSFPFEYPEANTYGRVTPDSSFYPVDVGDMPEAIDTGAKPLLRAFARPGTGHPNGYTYVWAANSGRYLDVTMDFTSDNTMDGDEDYATVHVKTPTGVKDYRVTIAERTWGDVAFTYTDKVSYQHKLYSFRIPWSEIGATPKTVELSFTAYGTATPVTPVFRFYNKVNDSHFYTISPAERVSAAAMGSVYTDEGVAWGVNVSNLLNSTPLYRFYSRTKGFHFYTASAAEKASVETNLSTVYALEGPAFNVCMAPPPGSATIYRFYNKKNGAHFYTASEAERDSVVANLSATYVLEGPAFYLVP